MNNPAQSRLSRVLIVKTGWSETLDPDTSGVVSLGDILRTTVVLHLFPPEEYDVTWLVDPKGVDLLKGNPRIQRILPVTPFTPFLLMSEWFDIVANFEKDPGICAMVDKISAWRRYGFRFDHDSRQAHAYDLSGDAIEFARSPEVKRSSPLSWSQMLFAMLGEQYRGEPYLIGRHPHGGECLDVGLNHLVGGKFPIKRWPEGNWQSLHEELTAAGLAVDWQRGANDIGEYIDWIAGCRLLVTNDSLGLHIALALGKKVVALFGPTKPCEVDDRPGLAKLTPEVDWPCIPCLAPTCHRSELCVAHIPVTRVVDAVARLLQPKGETGHV